MDELLILRAYLARCGRRLRLRDGWLLAQRSLWAACLAAGLIQLAGRIWPVVRLRRWTLAPVGTWLLVAVAIALLRPLPPMRVARRADAELGLKERLATALMLEGWKVGRGKGSVQRTARPVFQPHLVLRQRQDALSVAQAIDPRRAFPLCWLRRPLLLAAFLLVLTVTSVLWPNPMDAVLAERAAIARAVEEQAEQVETLRQEIEQAQELSAEERKALLRQLAELVEQFRANLGDREEALADLSRVEETLRRKLDPNAGARQAALEALAAQLQALAEGEGGEKVAPSEAAGALKARAEKLADMVAAEREALARALAQMAARVAQSGDARLAQALAALAQAAQSGDGDAAAQAAQATADALAQAQRELADQAALQRSLSQLQESRGAIAQAGQGQGEGQAAAQGQGQGPPGGGGGTQADTLPPARRAGRAGRPQGEGEPGAVGELDGKVYVPWERRSGSGEEMVITGSETGQGETQVREAKEPLPGAPGQALVPYHEVYYVYLDAANQAMERSYIPAGLRDYVREYFSQLEP
ncbi:MAG: hypothetical protein JSV36_05230 [Anaerolineae bacterium]|nr:MAG: hypothetical protein JSV36_05230 [Anaerolineae bacterium]